MPTVERDFSQEYVTFAFAMDDVCGLCIRPSDLEGTGEPCNSCYVRKTYDWYLEMLDNEEDE